MSVENKLYPQPRADEINNMFLEGWREGRIFLQRCAHCGLTYFYPRPQCPRCWSTELEWRESEGHGIVVSYSLVYRPNHPVFFDETPIVLAEVRLNEGATMIARIICDNPAEMHSGLALELLPPDAATRFPLPTFRAAV